MTTQSDWQQRMQFLLNQPIGGLRTLANYEVYVEVETSSHTCGCGDRATLLGVNIIRDLCADCFESNRIIEVLAA